MELKSMQQLLVQFRQIQERLQKQMDELQVEATAGGGMVSVKMNGQKRLTEVRIDPEVFSSKDAEMLQDLLLAAVNDASRRVDEALAQQINNMAGGMPGIAGLRLPGLF